MRFSPALRDKLSKAGWFEGRNREADLNKYQQLLGPVLHHSAMETLKEFDGLSIVARVFFKWCHVSSALDMLSRLPEVFRGSLCPVATTSYWSDTDVWMDAQGAVYLLEPDELSYLAPTMDAALEILVFYGELAAPPEQLKPGHWDLIEEQPAENSMASA